MLKKQHKVPDWMVPLYEGAYTFYVLYGGRGGGKSYCVADFLLIKSFKEHNVTFLCCREFQKSLQESVQFLLSKRIRDLGFSSNFRITKEGVKNLATGTNFIFVGLHQHPENVKSIPDIKYVWVEEAAYISKESWDLLIPTVTRNEGCQIICTLNPLLKSDIIYHTFVENKPPPDSYVKKVSYRENPYPIGKKFFSILEYTKENDYEAYLHKYEGECLTNSEAQVFKTPQHWIVSKFDDDPKAFKYFGLDFGFSQDPTAGIRCYVVDKKLYISHEAFKKELELDHTGEFLEHMLPDLKKYVIYADCANPGSISYLKRQGYRIEPVKKGAGSVEDGIAYMKSFDKIVVHERCENLINELSNHSYKVDERSGIISSIFVDADNHGIDATRYALERLARSSRPSYSKIKLENWI